MNVYYKILNKVILMLIVLTDVFQFLWHCVTLYLDGYGWKAIRIRNIDSLLVYISIKLI